MELYQTAISVRKELLRQIRTMEATAKELPKGEVRPASRGKTSVWEVIRNGKTKIVPMEAADETIQKICYRVYLEDSIEKMKQEVAALESYIELHPQQFAETDPRYNIDPWRTTLANYHRQSNTPAERWQRLAFNTDPSDQDQLKIRTRRGDLVRTAGECTIADCLFQSRIPYRYRCELKLDSKLFYPTFTILQPKTKATLILELFDRMDDANRREEAVRKLCRYAACGYSINANLLIAFETKDKPLDYWQFRKYLSSFVK